MAEKNLVIITLPNGMMIIGRKFGKDIKRPMLVMIQEQTKDGMIRFGLREIPFVNKADIMIGEGYSYWHPVADKTIEDLYAQATSMIIMPEMSLATGMGGPMQ